MAARVGFIWAEGRTMLILEVVAVEQGGLTAAAAAVAAIS